MTTYQTAYSANNNVNVANGDTPASGITVNTLRFNGNNTLNLSGTNTVNTGGVLVTNAATTGATISGGTLISGGGRELVLINNGAQLTVGSVIANSGGNASRLTLSGTGTTILNGLNTYTGATTINNGTVRAGSTQALGMSGSSAVTIAENPNAVLDLNGNDLSIASLNGTRTAVLGGGPTVGTSGGTLALGASSLTLGSGAFGGTITGAGGRLVKTGAGTLTLSGSSSFSGGVTIRAGTVNLPQLNDNWTPLGTGAVTLGDAAGGSSNASLTYDGAFQSSVLSGSYTNNIVLAPNTTGTLTIRGAGTNCKATLAGNVTGTNNLTINSGNGVTTFNHAINNTGNVTVNWTSPNNTGGFNGSVGSNVVNVQLNQNNTGNNVSFTASFNNTGMITAAGSGNRSLTLNGVIGNTTGVTQNSTTSLLILNAANTYTGDTLVQSGTLQLNNNLSIQNSAFDTSGAGVLVLNSVFTPTFGGLKGSTSLSTTNVSGYGSVTALTLNPQSGKSYSYSGNIGNGAVAGMTLTKSGSGTQVLSGSNSYSGATTVSTGMLQFATTNALYGGTTGSWTATNIRTGSGATLAFNVGGTGEFTTGNVTTLLTNLGSSSSATNGMNAGSFLGFDTTNAFGGTFTIADAIANSGGSSGGARGLRKLGTGSLVLAGTSTYTGPTIVSQGGLLVNGQLGNTAVTVQSGGLLGGAGTLLGAVSVQAGGTFSPGNSPGLLSTGELVLAGATLMEIDGLSPSRGVNYDAVNVSGQLTYGGSLLIDFGPLITTAFADNTIFDLFDFTSHTGAFTSITTANDGSWYAGLTFASTGNGDTWKAEKGSQTLEFTYSTGNLVIVPEPGAIALAGIGIAAAAYALCSRSPSRKRAG